jgi:dihydrodipicolinate synthase/N-acetylneuraminate lyase
VLADTISLMTKSTLLTQPLRGIIPPMATPLLDSRELDVAGLERLIERMLTGGVHGLFVLGSTGEGPNLSDPVRRALIEATCRLVAGRVPVLICITDNCAEESARLGEWAAECGADVLVSSTPYYFEVSQGDILRQIEYLAERLPLPLFLYNMPKLTKSQFAPETVARAAKIETVRGIKDSSGDLHYFASVVAAIGERPDFTLLTGPEEILQSSMALGGHGGVNGGANLFPELYVALYDAAAAGRIDEATRLQQRVVELGQFLYKVGEAESGYLRGLKLGLELMGVCSAAMTRPFAPANARDGELLLPRLQRFAAEWKS